MCGIAGTVGFVPAPGRMEKMLGVMSRRGPDGSGIWSEGAHEGRGGRVELGHRRLSIIDLATGQQPQVSPDGRFALVLNGEIYNYPELRPGLEQLGWRFRTTSDTEVLLAGLALRGPEFIFETVGMFAFALWDAREKSLLLARDRMGIKPLYYAEPSPGRLVFASELKAILQLEEFRPGGTPGRRLNAAAVDAFLALRFTPGPDTLVEGIQKFPPGHWAVFKDGTLKFRRYWDIRFDSGGAPGAGGPDRPPADDLETEERFAGLLRDAVRLCLRADVDCGAFLSGGVDSTVITGLMASMSARPVRTYSIGFGTSDDETDEAARTAERFGTVHTELRFEPSDLRRLPELAGHLDEPFSDPIALAMWLLAEKAGRDVKVVLTGEGADELLAGYAHHPHFGSIERRLQHLPDFALRAAGRAVRGVPVAWLDRLFSYPASIGRIGRDRLAEFIPLMKRPVDGYLAYVSLFLEQERRRVLHPDLRARLAAGPTLAARRVAECMGLSVDGGSAAGAVKLDRILDCEHRLWLADNILFKQDRTLMAASVEGRVPYCDHRLVEFAVRLPMRFKLGGGSNKRILRTAAKKLFPLSAGPAPAGKKPFLVPTDGALGRAQAGMARTVLLDKKCRDRGLFDPKAVESLLDPDRRDGSSFLEQKQRMALTMLELWMENVFDN